MDNEKRKYSCNVPPKTKVHDNPAYGFIRGRLRKIDLGILHHIQKDRGEAIKRQQADNYNLCVAWSGKSRMLILI